MFRRFGDFHKYKAEIGVIYMVDGGNDNSLHGDKPRTLSGVSSVNDATI